MSESAASSAAESAAESVTEATQGGKVGVCIYKFDDAFMTTYRNALQEILEGKGYEVTIVDGNNDQAKQNEQINTFITQGVDALIINPVMTSAADQIISTVKGAEDVYKRQAMIPPMQTPLRRCTVKNWKCAIRADRCFCRQSLSLIHIYYDPTKEPIVVKIDADKAKQWLANGAQPTDTVRELLKKASVL